MKMNKLIAMGALTLSLALTGCSDASVASHNISKASDYFQVNRRVVFYNGITGEYMLTIEGLLSIDHSSNQLEVTVKTGKEDYKKHFLGLSHNVTYFCEQIENSKVDPYHYKVVFKPTSIIPDIDFMKNRTKGYIEK